jgi:nucleoside-diphosphate-sugar epimerase
VTVLRIAMFYGPDQPDLDKLVPHVYTALARGVAPSVGSGTRGVDWVYVEDVAEALVLAAVGPDAPGRVLDVGSGRAVTIAEVVAELADLAGHHDPPGLGDRADRREEHVHLADPRAGRRGAGLARAHPAARRARTHAGLVPRPHRGRGGGVMVVAGRGAH